MSSDNDSDSFTDELENNTWEFVAVDELSSHPKNEEIYGEIDPDESFVEDIEQNGVETPIVANDHEDCPNTVIGGHRRLESATQVGISQVPVRWVSYPEPLATRRVVKNNNQRKKSKGQQTREALVLEETARSLAKERIEWASDEPPESIDSGGSSGRWYEQVGEQIGLSGKSVQRGTDVFRMAYPDKYVDEEHHNEEKYDVSESVRKVAQEQVESMDNGEQSFNGAHKAVQKAIKENASKDAMDAVETEVEPAVAVSDGDVWELGNHILYCGDTASSEFKSLCAEHTPFALGFADPPYGADAADWDDEFVWEHDYLHDISDVVGVTPGIVSIFDFAERTSMPYQWSIASWIKNGMTRGDMGFGNWIYVALFADEDTSLHRDSQDVLRITIDTGETSETDHKGRKPSELMVWLIDRFSTEGDVIVDPFAGSGSTLFAAEGMDRTCITGDIDTEFCEEIIGRWNENHSEKAIKR